MKDSENLKITVVVNGRFHAFDYAAELYKKGLLNRMISSMPYSVAKKYGIGREVYIGLPIFEVLKRSWRILLKKEFSPVMYSKLFTKTALRFITSETDVVIANAGCCEEIFKAAKLKNAMKILDRGSTHALSNIYLNKLAAEYHHVDWIPNPIHYVERELREYGLADKILIPSTFVEQTFIDNGISMEKLIKIPYAFSLKKFEGFNLEPQLRNPAVLFVGQISPRKGIGVLINAMKLVRNTMPDATLWIVGAKNPLIPNSLLEEKWISYFGILRGQELLEKYNSASVFCLPSFEEGLALVLTEAQYCRIPIVATPNSGAADIIKNGVNGFIVPAGNHIKTADKIIEILKMGHTQQNENLEVKIENNQMTWEKYCELLTDNILSNN
jgi:alpha-maltose-1-phosphate synthase